MSELYEVRFSLFINKDEFVPVFVALISVLSAVGICERCRIESGGVYFLLAHTLGSRLGGALGMIYCFGQVCVHVEIFKQALPGTSICRLEFCDLQFL